MSYVIINDNHIGINRKSGATPESMEMFQKAQLNVLHQAVKDAETTESDIIILGDLFDKPTVSYDALWRVCNILQSFDGRILLVTGNHDEGGNKVQLTALGLLNRILDNTVLINTPWHLTGDCWIIPHCVNQVAFDSAVDEVVARGATSLLAHCNYDNPFTEGKDHSLNLTPEQASKFGHVILGHEHQKRDLLGIDILGAPLPCSISECSKAKGHHRWEGPGHEVEFTEAWNTETGYAEIDWHDLHGLTATTDFVRVIGTGEPEEAALIIQEVAKFREKSPAFFISNSVKIGDIDLSLVEEASSADLHTFNPRAELMACLPEQYQEKMRRFLS